MRVKLTFAAITAATLAIVACEPVKEPTPQHGPTITLQSECDEAMTVPPYSVEYQGATVDVPSGPAQFADMVADGEISETEACRLINSQYKARTIG